MQGITNQENMLPSMLYKNYMYNEKVFLLDEITSDNCAFLIGELTSFILNPENMGKKIFFIINSPGGEVSVMMTIIGLINMAKLYDIEIFTFVLGQAGSAASLIAVQGSQRMMSRFATHFIHFGSIYTITTKKSEIEKICEQTLEYSEQMENLYLKACKGKLTLNDLHTFQADERGYLSAQQCLKYGLCDAVIENELDEKEYELSIRDAFEDQYDDFYKQKNKEIKQNRKQVKKRGNS